MRQVISGGVWYDHQRKSLDHVHAFLGEPSNKAVYDYPVLAIRDMTVWEERTRSHYPFAGYSNYYGY
ncbi:MAG: hypothetical protein ACXW37_04375, partial [Nitrospira sp.]